MDIELKDIETNKQLSLRMQLIKLHVERVAIELKIKLLREKILKESK